jgi:hypothetical protein
MGLMSQGVALMNDVSAFQAEGMGRKYQVEGLRFLNNGQGPL